MFMEIEDETRDFVTIYRKDFLGRETKKRREYRPQRKYPLPLNILNGPYRKCLNTRQQNFSLPVNEQSEDPQEYLNKIRNEHPLLKKIFPEVAPNENVIEEKENRITQTIYHTDYSKGDYSSRIKIYGKWKDIHLPDDWIISETIQRKSYRNPWKIATENLLLISRSEKPPDNLKPSQKEREILRIRTGDTEYNATIDATGSKIIDECLLGAPLPVEPNMYVTEPDSSLSECSKVLTEKKIALPSNVF
ncbi:uncharacterized protein LOC128890633 [Hylaeus anthracinus]|uniref:uncharacterized protein LOC128890633 n=1 Tax=Hylaeus anthracinus TaxID=313031 RepID=UPI0023B9B859|nr:uncharacterized protein LOC128890633 [Hylaeus anthracinus]